MKSTWWCFPLCMQFFIIYLIEDLIFPLRIHRNHRFKIGMHRKPNSRFETKMLEKTLDQMLGQAGVSNPQLEGPTQVAMNIVCVSYLTPSLALSSVHVHPSCAHAAAAQPARAHQEGAGRMQRGDE